MRSRPILNITLVILLHFALVNSVEVNEIANGFHNIRISYMNFDSNILVVEGEEGLLLVDAGYDVTSEEVYHAIRAISSKPIKYLINTHAHMDHFGGNARMGPDVTLLAHEDARSEITGEYYSLGANPRFNLPAISFKDEIMFNVFDQKIRIFTLKGHTGNDVVVEFQDADIVCVGGLVYSYQFPIIDRSRGGDLEDLLASIKYLNDNLSEDVIIITSHGERYSKKELKEHYEMLISTSSLIRNEIEAGSTIEDLISRDLLKDWGEWQGSFVSKDTWITMAYNSLEGTEIETLPSIVDPLTETIMQSGIDPAIEQFFALKESKPDDYNFGEMEINMLGYNLMYRSMFEEAQKIFQLNIELFPESSNVYDSLGELFMNTGKKELAIENYLKSLELNPENKNADMMIEKIKQR